MKKALLIVLVWMLHHAGAQAQNFVYRPVNPAFGGNFLNYNWLQSSATAQDRLKDPNAEDTSTSARDSRATGTSADDFAASLQRQLLNSISRQVIRDQFGEGSLQPGTYQFGDTQVDISEGSEGLVIRIVDGQGGESTITVPYY